MRLTAFACDELTVCSTGCHTCHNCYADAAAHSIPRINSAEPDIADEPWSAWPGTRRVKNDTGGHCNINDSQHCELCGGRYEG